MQQQEQPILKRLAEAREAQARAMTRFMQARERMVAVDVRLQALHARLATSQTPSPQLPETGMAPPDAANVSNTSAAEDISLAKTSALSSNDADDISIAETAALPGDETDEPAHEPTSEEDTKKLRALRLARSKQDSTQEAETGEQCAPASAPPTPDTPIETHSDAAAEAQDTSATDITTKIPVIRREDHQTQEPQERC